MTLKVWSFSKKRNSTAQPTAAGRTYNVALKENTSIEKPVFILGTGIDAEINFCQAFGNYYFIDDIVMLSADQCELHCSLDVLATHKTAIGAYNCHIDRASSTHNSWLIDDAMSAEQNIVKEYVATTELFPYDATGCYIVRTVSPNSSPTGIVSWVMSESDLSYLLDFITTDSNFSDVLTDTVVKTFFNPFQYILDIKWFPIDKNDIAGKDRTLRLGWWDVDNHTFKKLTSALYYDNVNVNIPNNYYSGDFRAYTQSYTRLIADICNLGVIELDPMLLKGGTINCRVCIDWITGEMRLTFGHRGSQGGVTVNTDAFTSYSGMLGVSVNVGQMAGMSGQVLAASSNMGVLEAAASGFVGAVGDIISGIKNAIAPTTSVIGSSGNKASIISNPRLLLYIRNYGCGEFANVVYGRPLRSNRIINTLQGYIKCMNASISLPAPATEIDEVNRLLNSGFYYE